MEFFHFSDGTPIFFLGGGGGGGRWTWDLVGQNQSLLRHCPITDCYLQPFNNMNETLEYLQRQLVDPEKKGKKEKNEN